jgi:hypothetical protein
MNIHSMSLKSPGKTTRKKQHNDMSTEVPLKVEVGTVIPIEILLSIATIFWFYCI